MKIRFITICILICATAIGITNAQQTYKIGIIGLDTSHSPAFIKYLNGGEAEKSEYKDFKIIAAYPYGSRTIKSSYSRIPGYIDEAKKYGVEIVGSISELLQKVDFVMLETNDGNMHLEQAAEVFKSGKPIFIDKPVAANLSDAIAIFMLADKYNIPMFSSSSLRYVTRNQELRNGKYGKVYGADCYSPSHSEPSHPDFSWYGIHGVETLYTIMGTGCQKVSRTHAEGMDVVVGLWKDGRIGTFRGIREGKEGYGGTVICEKQIVQAGDYAGYGVLLDQILKFFKTKQSPIDKKETLEIFSFMEASNVSMKHNGAQISLQSVFEKGQKEALKKLKKYK
ncbi:MAG: Gfo/Idh/MocA family oxidoreductase [Parabacteroides sp.]|nr:Gfo/Idh/MocA family oxidoreductase [Parabacteroides sp.]